MSAVDGSTTKVRHFDNLASFESCKVQIHGLFDENGTELCTEVTFGPKSMNEIKLAEPNCNFVEVRGGPRLSHHSAT